MRASRPCAIRARLEEARRGKYFGGLNVKFDLQKMSYRELLDFSHKVKSAIEAKKQAEKSTIKKQVQDLIKQSGFDMDDIVGKASTKSLKGRKVAAKYRNPKNPEAVSYTHLTLPTILLV